MAANFGGGAQAAANVGISEAMQSVIIAQINLSINHALDDFDLRTAVARINEIGEQTGKILGDARVMVENLETEKANVMKKEKELGDKLDGEFARLTLSMNEHAGKVASEQKAMGEFINAQQVGYQAAMQTSRKELDALVTGAAEFGTGVRRFVEESMSKIGGNSGGGSSSGEGRRAKLNDPKETSVDTLPENVSKAAFQLWRTNLDLHLEGFPEFGPGVCGLLRQVRLGGSRPDRGKLIEYKNMVNQQSNDNGHGSMFDDYWSPENASRELYKFLHKRLSVALKAETILCPGHDGFELYRQINSHLDPVAKVAQHTVLSEIRRLTFCKCKNLSETQSALVKLEQICMEYVDKTGKMVDDNEKKFAVWYFMDENTIQRLEQKGLQEGESEYKDVIDQIELLRNEINNKKVAADYGKKSGDKMDLSLVGPDGEAQGQEHPDNADDTLDKFGEFKCHSCNGVGHRWADCTSRPGVELACNTCGGWGHYANECPTKEKGGKVGKGKGKIGKGDGKGKGDKGSWEKGGKQGGKQGGGAIKGKSGAKGAWGKGFGKSPGKGFGKGKGGMHALEWGSEWNPWDDWSGNWGWGQSPGNIGVHSMQQPQQQGHDAPIAPSTAVPATNAQTQDQGWTRRLASFAPAKPINPIDPNVRRLCAFTNIDQVRVDETGYNTEIKWTFTESRKGKSHKVKVMSKKDRKEDEVGLGYWAEALGEKEVSSETGVESKSETSEESSTLEKMDDYGNVDSRIESFPATKPVKDPKKTRNKRRNNAKDRKMRLKNAQQIKEPNVKDSKKAVVNTGSQKIQLAPAPPPGLEILNFGDECDDGEEEERIEPPPLPHSASRIRRRIAATFQNCCNDESCSGAKPKALPKEIPLLAQNGNVHDPTAARYIPEEPVDEGDLTGMPNLSWDDDHISKEETGPAGSAQSWLVSADDGSQAGTVNIEDPKGAQTKPKPIPLEIRGPLGISKAVTSLCDAIEKYKTIIEEQSKHQEKIATSQIISQYDADGTAKLGNCASISSTAMSLNPFYESEAQALNGMSPSQWTLIELIVDSGACETVLPASLCSHIRLRESAGSKAKVEYEVASGKKIPNLGEKHCEVFVEGSASAMMMHFQVADIHRPLLSLSKCADQGFQSHLDYWGGWLEDTQTGECIPITRRGNLYIIQMWIRAAPGEATSPATSFVGPG